MESRSKVCSTCKEEKPRTEFHKDRRASCGISYRCKTCKNLYSKQNWKDNRDERLKYKKQHFRENRDRILLYKKDYRQKNRKRLSEYNYRYRQENRSYFNWWRQENRAVIAAHSSKRRALRIKAVPDTLVDCPKEKNRLDKIYRLRDIITRATGIEYHVDHIWPLSKGGPHWSGNLQVITAEENLSKSDTLCEETARVIQESLDEYLSSRLRG